MVFVRARILEEGDTIADHGDDVLIEGQLCYLQEGATRYLLVGDGTSTISELIAAGHYFVRQSDLP